MEYKAISKKTMRSKDFKALRAKKPGYRMHIAITEDNTKEVLFRTPRGFFLQDSSEPAIEISVTQAPSELKQAGRYDQRRAQRKSIKTHSNIRER